jgi:pantoate--beta-alanine ligase
MGALHKGHISLLEHAAAKGGQVIVSIFVNPLQFERPEDLEIYPRTLEQDLTLLEEIGVAAVYMPEVAEMYPEGHQVGIDPGPAAFRLEGAARPGHFAGMLTVVHKLFQHCRPDVAWFGEKDAQQLFLVKRMVMDLELPVEVQGCPTFREADGLAYSSRNVHLSAANRKEALVLWKSLQAAHAAFADGERDPRRIEGRMLERFEGSAAELAYAQVVSDFDFDLPTPQTRGAWRAVVGARLDGVHLLDNLLLGRA